MERNSMHKVFDFREDLVRGDKGEQQFLLTFSLYRKGEDVDRAEHDFLHSLSGATVELKTDYYSMHKTPNLIVERWSSIEKQKPGGPYRHSQDLTYWVYYYIQEGVFLFYDAQQLVEKVNFLQLPITQVHNRGYTTGVYKVRRQDVEDCLIDMVHITPQ
jgi:hypothetical protein